MIRELEITILMDNTTFKHGITAEHGLSLFLRTDKGNILFDTGASAAFLANAKRLGVPIDDIDAVVLSHGHYDHTGGLRALLEMKKHLNIYVHNDAFQAKAKKEESGRYSPIGIPWSRDELESSGAQFVEVKGPQEITNGVLLTGAIPRETSFEFPNETLCVEEDGRMWVDPLWDDQALIINMGGGSVLITGCAHSGLVNTLEYAQRLGCTQPIHSLIGGTHLLDASEKQIQETINYLKGVGFSQLIALHCTGFHAASKMAEAFDERFYFGSAGETWRFTPPSK